MALTPTTQIPLGFKAPAFRLPDTLSDSEKSYQDIRGEKATLIMFICNHCPFVVHVKDELVRIAKDYQEQGVGFVAISSNDVTTHPQDGPEQMKSTGIDWGLPFPYLYDESQEVAKAYDAACTPDFALFDAHDVCVYRGRLDESRPGNEAPLNGKDMRAAIDAVMKGEPIPEPHWPSMGCNIKWKSA